MIGSIKTSTSASPSSCINVMAGAFIDHLGIFDRRDDDRVFVLSKLLGREVRVRLPIDAIGS